MPGRSLRESFKRGDRVMVLPSGRTSKVKSIVTFDGDLEEAYAPQSVTVCLEDEIDISRGDMLVKPSRMPHVSRRFEATIVWMADRSDAGRPAVSGEAHLAAGPGAVSAICIIASISTIFRKFQSSELELNEIGVVSIETHRPLFFDAYRKNRGTGAFILIDPVSNLTVGGRA